MGVPYQYPHEREPAAAWYQSFWFLLVLLAAIVLAILWFTMRQQADLREEAAAAPGVPVVQEHRSLPQVVPAVYYHRLGQRTRRTTRV